MKLAKATLLACAAAYCSPLMAAETTDDDAKKTDRKPEAVFVTATREATSATKTDTPLLYTPQAITVVTDDLYEAQGAVSIADTLRYVAGVQANSYGPDSRVDGSMIRGIEPLQFRDGMRDLYSYYASIRSDPYNFSQVEVVRGPASVLFGTSSIGGLVNMVSKTPRFEPGGEVSVRYGSFDRKELLGDVTGQIAEGLAGRLVARLRDSGTQTDHVPDDRALASGSLLWQPGDDTDITLIGVYQEDDGGSTSQFLPLVGTIYPNPNGKLPNDLFVGKPGWDRYDGRLLQGTAIVEHRFSDSIKLNARARYIDSNLTYFTHYPDSYSNPSNPYLDPDQRIIGLYADGSYARMNVFSTDTNAQFAFDTGENIQHLVLTGIDYSWNRVRKTGGFDYEFIDIYDIDYDALSDFGGGIPTAFTSSEDVSQKQLGFYVQDQIRLWDRVSVVLGGRRDYVRSRSFGVAADKANATSLRGGVIAEVLPGISPYVSYTESFEPITGTASNGDPFKPKRGRQYEAGVKFSPDEQTLITLAAYHIRESNRPIDDPSTPDPFDQMQAGLLTSKGFEAEARRMLPGNYEVIANFSYNHTRADGSTQQLDNVPRYNASLWTTKTFDLGSEFSLRVGGGVRYSGSNWSGTVRTPSYTLADALVELSWRHWVFAVNANNLFDKKFYAACLSRGDCFIGEARNVFGTLTYRF
jgi:iron complex outermembrane receptor protein